jgi:TfoX/Sxy family transcriptional regulator of competence genes
VAFDEELAERIRDVLGPRPELAEKKMFGGLAFLLQGNMCCGVLGDEMIVRVGPDQDADALAQPGARPFDITGRPMSGWILVTADAAASTDTLIEWVDRALAFVTTLPPGGTAKAKSRAKRKSTT